MISRNHLSCFGTIAFLHNSFQLSPYLRDKVSSEHWPIIPLHVEFLCKIDSCLAKTQMKFEELKELIKVSIICIEYGSNIKVPLLVKAVMRKHTDFMRTLPQEDSWSKKSTVKNKTLDLTNPLFFLETKTVTLFLLRLLHPFQNVGSGSCGCAFKENLTRHRTMRFFFFMCVLHWQMKIKFNYLYNTPSDGEDAPNISGAAILVSPFPVWS